MAHGAWHPPSLYDSLKRALAVRGYELLVPELATMGLGKTGMSWNADVAMLLENATPLFDQGRSVILLGHSYGGFQLVSLLEATLSMSDVVMGKGVDSVASYSLLHL